MGFFRKLLPPIFKKKKVPDKPEFKTNITDDFIQSMQNVWQQSNIVQQSFNMNEPESTQDAIDYVNKPSDFKWFKCSFCRRKVLASNNENMFYFNEHVDYNGAKRKVCKDCVAEIAFGMNVNFDDIKKAEKRLILNKLKGDKNGED